MPRFGARLPLPILPAGVAVGLIYRWGYRLWPAILLASVGIDLSQGHPLDGALVAAVGFCAATALTVYLLKRAEFDRQFARARDVPTFIVAAAVGMSVAATFGMLAFWVGGGGWEAPTFVKWVRWWSNTTVGVLLIGPLIVAASRESMDKLRGQRVLAAFWLLAVLACCASIVLTAHPLVRPLRVMFALSVIIVGAFRFGLVPTGTAALTIIATATYSFAFGHGAFGELTPLAGLVLMWVGAASLTGLTLTTTALLAERDAAALERLRAEHRYAQIFEANPQPLWVHAADDGSVLLANEAAARQYGWTRAQFLSLHIADLATAGPIGAVPEQGQDGDGADPSTGPFETRHRCRDQRLIDVEVWTRRIEFEGRVAVLVFATDVTERRAFGGALMDAVAAEQRRIGQEMHDGLGQELTGLALSVQALATRADRDRLSIVADLRQIASLANACIADAHRIVQGLAPLSDVDDSLESALAALARRMSIGGVEVGCECRIDGILGLDIETRAHLFRIAQEAVQNALKHAAARTVSISLLADPERVRLEVGDNGTGLLDTSTHRSGLGMRTMRFRASVIGARLSVEQRPGGGTLVLCDLGRSTGRA